MCWTLCWTWRHSGERSWRRLQFSLVAQSCPTLCDPRVGSTARLLCPSTTPGAYSNLCPLSRWCHPTISSSVVPFSRPQSFPVSGSFPVSQFFASGGQFWSLSFSISPSNEYSGLISFRMDSLDLLAVQVSQEFFPTPQFKNRLTLRRIWGLVKEKGGPSCRTVGNTVTLRLTQDYHDFH